MSKIPAFEKLRQEEHHEYQAILSYTVRVCFIKNKGEKQNFCLPQFTVQSLQICVSY